LAERKETSAVSRFNPRLIRVEDRADARRILEELGSDKAGVKIMARKMQHLSIHVENVQARAAHIIKEVMLSKGGECATPKDLLVVEGTERVNVIIIGTITHLRKLISNLSVQPFGMKALSVELKDLLQSVVETGPRILDAGGHMLEIGGRTLVMGVINTTPDSFSDGGSFDTLEKARKRALEMQEAGVDIIDIGGESTRPGAEPLPPDEELRRTIPLIESLEGEIDVPISIDTYKSGVAGRALDAGACIINDITALRFDEKLAPLAARRGAPVILMHMQGEPRNMQEDPQYEDVVGDISRFFRERAAAAVEAGISPEKLLVDPGIGFGKTVEHNLEILRRIEEFRGLGYPLVLGTSRKRFIGAVLDRPVDQRLLGTAATVAFAIARGVDVVRVHDTEEMLEVVKMADAAAGKSRQFD
jgi:dihydropteroate synthase